VSAATLDELRQSLGGGSSSAVYAKKMLHVVPPTKVVDRPAFVLERVAGKRVLEFGASGELTTQIQQGCRKYLGVDREAGHGVVAFDLDDVQQDDLPRCEPQPEVIVCGELLEHLSNPGWFLARLRRQYAGVPVIITVPNAQPVAGLKHLQRGVENVNRDHVAWYSYRTLKTLVEREGYTVKDFAWYNGQPLFAEGLIFVVE
jgi:hypothetical protein